MMTPKMKNWIDKASYADLIAKVHGEPPNSEWFQDDAGQYLFAALNARVRALIQQEAVSFKYLTSASAEQAYGKAA